MSRPSTSHQSSPYPGGVKRSQVFEEKYEDPSYVGLPSNDTNAWYYPSPGYDSGEDSDVQLSAVAGNWGRKTLGGARWVRRGKMAAWGPGTEDWETEERARKRIKLLLGAEPDPDAPITLPHLRSPTPPLTAPYPLPASQHLSYSSFVLDKSVTSTYRSTILDEQEQATNTLIEGEAAFRRALGRLFQVMSEDPDRPGGSTDVVPKREDEELGEDGDKERRLARAPDLMPVTHKLFLTRYSNQSETPYENSQFTHPDMQQENLEKSLAVLRDLQDDQREYVERLEEIRETLGEVRIQRDAVWNVVRKEAIGELEHAAAAATSAID